MHYNKHKASPVKESLSQERLRELFDYDPVKGNLIWKTRQLSEFATERAGKIWNARFAGTAAGTLSQNGYIQIRIQKKLYTSHRFIWVWCNGFLSKDSQIDHINGEKSDNRTCNLRLATKSQNQSNSKIPKDNTSGIKGVSWYKNAKKWVAKIGIFGKLKHLGYYENITDAAAAYAAASEELNKEFTHSSTKIHNRKVFQLQT